MTGRDLKASIFRYLKERGWRNLRPGEYYAWDKPENPKFANDPDYKPQHYCWHAALVVQIAKDEGEQVHIPAGAFEVLEGGRR